MRREKLHRDDAAAETLKATRGGGAPPTAT
jgi:hypothetical protein